MTNDRSHRSAASPKVRALWIGLLILIAVYMFARPTLERKLGVELPGFSGDAEESVAPDSPAGPETSPDRSDFDTDRAGSPNDAGLPDGADARDRTYADDGNAPPLGGLTEVGNDTWVSTAGLRYTPGSQEGHRLKHVMRHDNDLPDRPGKHGVFDGDQQALLAVLDEAYELIKEDSPQVHANREGDRTVYEVDMQRRIGFVGGRDGKRDGNPPAQHIRLVLEVDRVITAFPY